VKLQPVTVTGGRPQRKKGCYFSDTDVVSSDNSWSSTAFSPAASGVCREARLPPGRRSSDPRRFDAGAGE
jgi:hypothetical protein